MTEQQPDPEFRAERDAATEAEDSRVTLDGAAAGAADVSLDDAPFDPLIPSDVVCGGDPGLAELITRHAIALERMRI